MADQNSQYMAMLTAVGEAKQANAIALGVNLNITHLGVGDANGAEPMPSRTQTALINERRRAPLNQLSIDPNNSAIVIAEQVIPEDVGGWWIREIGLYDEAGDLVAVSNCPPTFKPELAQGSGRTQVVRLNILVSSTQNIQLKIDPSVVLATRAHVSEQLTLHVAAADPHKQYALRGKVTTLSANASLTAGHEGLVLLDASSGARTFSLPESNATLGIIDLLVRRVDNSGNRLKIQTAGTDKIKFHTHLRAEGYAFTVLMGAGDWWRLRSDGQGGWWPVGRHDSTPLGRPVFETTTVFAPGGYGALNGAEFQRSDWPWLWDHAQQSGMLTTEAARVGMEGGWTSGDGALTFRGPEGRGEFLRLVDDGRGVDASRQAGSSQSSALQHHQHYLPTSTGVNGGTAVIPDTSFGYSVANNAPSSGMTASTWGGDGYPSGTFAAETRPRNIAYPGRIKLI
ncbi:phage tail protein [Stutzerimonas urumqiensis]|uniref:phage tail protein n=1 Tax=Stutzerimonas urumqiensis TaxID=638269 RepID=UPI003BA99621